MKWQMTTTPKLFIVYWYYRWFYISMGNFWTSRSNRPDMGTPAGTFFSVIGTSLGFTDSTTAQYVGFALHVLTGMVCWKYLWTDCIVLA